MAVTVTVSDDKTEQSLQYPCLMQSTKSPLVVLFESVESGVVVMGCDTLYDVDGRHNVGHIAHDWIDAHDWRQWKPFEGTITLKNQ